MLTFVGLLWTIGVVCLLAAAVGSRLRLPSTEIEAVTSPKVRIAVALIGAIAIALGVVLLAVDSARSQPPSAISSPAPQTSAAESPSSEPIATPTPTPVPSPSATPTTTPTPEPPPPETPAPRKIVVWWQGSLVLGGYGGGPGGGWYLDQSPPGRAMFGDLGYNGSNTITGHAMVRWDGDAPPKQPECAALLDSHLGQRSVDVRKGTIACLRTIGGRVGYARVDRISGSSDLNPTMTAAVVVWDRE